MNRYLAQAIAALGHDRVVMGIAQDEGGGEENPEALETGRVLPRLEGILAGISTGANIHAALQLAAMPQNKDKTIVTVACSTGERYLSTVLFDQS